LHSEHVATAAVEAAAAALGMRAKTNSQVGHFQISRCWNVGWPTGKYSLLLLGRVSIFADAVQKKKKKKKKKKRGR
jgi:hypothetical protein